MNEETAAYEAFIQSAMRYNEQSSSAAITSIQDQQMQRLQHWNSVIAEREANALARMKLILDSGN